MLRELAATLKTQGLGGVASAAWRRLAKPVAPTFSAARPLLEGRYGLEIGGPSDVFARGSLLPVYSVAGRIDNCTFAAKTLWSERPGGTAFHFAPGREPGTQYVREATELSGIPDGRYDFVVSSHMLEHSANPLKALREWVRVVRPGGAFLLVLPHKDGTFDHLRPTTTLEHLEADLANGTGEDDLTHLPEILMLHDLSRDPGAGTRDAFDARSRENATNRGLHQHVFDTRSAAGAVASQGLRLAAVDALRPYHIVLLATKEAALPDEQVRSLVADALRRSPFASDRRSRAPGSTGPRSAS